MGLRVRKQPFSVDCRGSGFLPRAAQVSPDLILAAGILLLVGVLAKHVIVPLLAVLVHRKLQPLKIS